MQLAGCFHAVTPGSPGGGYRIAFVRHPLDRLVSVWAFFCKEERARGMVDPTRYGYRAGQKFDEWLDIVLSDPERDKHTRPLSVYYDGLEMEHWARLENLPEEWARLRRRYPLITSEMPVMNKTDRKGWEDYYDPAIRQRAETVFAADLALWGLT